MSLKYEPASEQVVVSDLQQAMACFVALVPGDALLIRGVNPKP